MAMLSFCGFDVSKDRLDDLESILRDNMLKILCRPLRSPIERELAEEWA
jgi:hypothetical protein